jgi:hypothetical protein
LLTLPAQAQKTHRTITVNGQVLPVPDDATTGTAKAVAAITMPAVDPTICTSTNSNCYTRSSPPPSNGAAGSQCGWIGLYNQLFGNRSPCLGNTLGYGNVAICAAPAVGPDAYNQCKEWQDVPCYLDACNATQAWVVVPPSGSYFGPVSYVGVLTDWHCPAGYTPTQMIAGGGSNGQDSFYTCIKN